MALRNAIGALLGAFALSAIAVTGCNLDGASEGGLSADDPDAITTTVVSGSVGDGPIRDARVRTFTNADEEVRRSETRSDSTADYEITVRTQGRNYPLTLVADEGTDMVTNAPPDFSLVSVVMSPSRNETANLNPYSTLIVRTAQKSGGISFETIAEATDTVVERYGFGLGSRLIVHPVFSPMDHTNVHVVVKASETVGEMIRRTRDAVTPGCAYGDAATWRCGDEVVNTLAADLADGWIDGWIDGEATFDDRRVAAVANVASAAVMLEALANQLRIDFYNLRPELARAQMDSAIALVRPEATLRTGDVAIPAEALLQARRALHAAKRVLLTRPTPDPAVPHVREAIYAVQTTPPGSTQLNPLPSDEEGALEWAIEALNRAIGYTADITDESLLDEINRIASSEDVPYLENPAEPKAQPDEPTLGTATLDWSPPDARADGTELEALAGYRIYYGTDANKLTRTLDVDDGEQTQKIVENLESGTWYFAITAFSSEGTESEKSNIGTKIIP